MKKQLESGGYVKSGSTPSGKHYTAYRHPDGQSTIKIIHGKDSRGYLITRTKHSSSKRNMLGVKGVKYENKQNPKTGKVEWSKRLFPGKKK